jgi:hypothetical protein
MDYNLQNVHLIGVIPLVIAALGLASDLPVNAGNI